MCIRLVAFGLASRVGIGTPAHGYAITPDGARFLRELNLKVATSKPEEEEAANAPGG
ncbi:MAG TPA: hypothetical protein VHR66_32385 [Gemmataceae bacterium]|jgi:hypothetical protein|nr:hypothetical protein [Gemmataceae bacterium]